MFIFSCACLNFSVFSNIYFDNFKNINGDQVLYGGRLCFSYYSVHTYIEVTLVSTLIACSFLLNSKMFILYSVNYCNSVQKIHLHSIFLHFIVFTMKYKCFNGCDSSSLRRVRNHTNGCASNYGATFIFMLKLVSLFYLIAILFDNITIIVISYSMSKRNLREFSYNPYNSHNFTLYLIIEFNYSYYSTLFILQLLRTYSNILKFYYINNYG